MKPHFDPLEELTGSLSADPAAGLTSAQAEERLRQYGENRLQEKKPKTFFQRFLDQFKDAMIIILLIAAAISFGVAISEGNISEFVEPLLILLIVVLNAVIGVIQENKAEKALEALKNLSAPHARVLRDGKEQIIDAARLVPGDIVRLAAGDFVPADARLLSSSALKSEESALTGESVPAEKDASAAVAEDAPLGDRLNMVFSGCSITYGRATALVTATGMDTEMGKIAGLLGGEEESQTPLQQKLGVLGKNLGFLALGACAVIFLVGLIDGLPLMDMFMTSVSLAVSAIPEGLPAIVTVVLSIGVQRMVKKNAIIRRLPAVETLGSASVICSDKTGTLTQNRMTLVRAYLDGGAEEDLSDPGHASEGVRRLLDLAALCCDGSVVEEGGKFHHIAAPTETAIVLAALQNGSSKEELNRKSPRLMDLPFDSDRKLMSTVNRVGDKLIVITKGAFDSIAARCVAGDLAKGSQVNDAMSREALRVLAVAWKAMGKAAGEAAASAFWDAFCGGGARRR